MRWSLRRLSAGAIVVSGFAFASACGWLPKKVAAEDCTAWVDQFTKLTKGYVAEAQKSCEGEWAKQDPKLPEDAEREKIGDEVKELNSLIDQSADQLKAGCTKNVGNSYLKKDADCYMAAKSIADWDKCKFTPASALFVSIQQAGADLQKTWTQSCNDGIVETIADQETSDAGTPAPEDAGPPPDAGKKKPTPPKKK